MCSDGERDLGGAGQVQPVALDRVDVRALGREEAGAVHRLLAHEHRRDHGREAVRDQLVEREAVEGERERARVADEVAEAGARDAGGALHVEAAELDVLARRRGGGSPPRRSSTASSSLVAVGHRLVGRVRHPCEQLVALGLGLGELLLGGASSSLTPFSSSTCSGVGFP